MYPRVKVRKEEKDQDQYDFEFKSLQSLKGFQFLSLDNLSFPDDSPTSVVRIPNLSSSSNSASTLKGESRDKKLNVSENNRTNRRASPVSRPRAVLSSPDNDGIIMTHKNKQGEELLLLGSKKQTLSQNGHSQCKKPIPVAVRLRTELKQVTDSANNDTRSKLKRRVLIPDQIKTADK